MTTSNEARRLLREGRVAEAERLSEAVLERFPDDVEALNIVALAAVRNGQPVRAMAMLERATSLDPANAVSFHNLGRAQDAAGNLPAALKSVAEAVRLKPDFYLSRLYYAMWLERSGETETSVMQYARALHDAQTRGQWVSAATTPVSLQQLVKHAVRIVRTRRRALLSAVAASMAGRHGQASMARVEKCLRVYLGEEAAEFPDPRQKPSFLYFPGLPASAYPDRSLFAWIASLEAETGAIRDELLRLLPSSQGRERVFTSDELEQQNLRGSGAVPGWNGYYFYRHGVRREDNCASCPITAAALDRLPLPRIRDHGPEVLFSVFTPGTHLLPHRGVTNTRVVGHLPLIVPKDCALKVGGEVHAWQEGKIVLFDDTYEHEAWNHSTEARVVLIFDVWNPHLTGIEQSAVTEVVEAIGDFREALERL